MSAHCSKCHEIRDCTLRGLALFCIVCASFIGILEDTALFEKKDDLPTRNYTELARYYEVSAIQASATTSTSTTSTSSTSSSSSTTTT